MCRDFFEDVDRLRMPHPQIERRSQTNSNGTSSLSKPRKVNGEFLKGPIPLNWLSVAAQLPGKAPLAVALAIIFEVGRRKSNEIVLTTAMCERFAVKRKAKYSGLKALEEANLISVERRSRKNPKVTVIERDIVESRVLLR